MGKILVTGVAGFIGSKTAEKLLEKNEEVIGIDNLNDYYDIRFKDWRLSNLKKRFPDFTFIHGDIEDCQFIKNFFEKYYDIDRVINLAARAGVRYSMENPAVYLATNAFGNLNILEEMRKNSIKKLVLASTSSLYADQPMPFKEDLAVNTPISPYAASKKAAEVMCYTYYYLYGIDVSIVRYFTVFGPAGRPDMSYFRFIKHIDEGKPIELFGDGAQARDFTYIDDIASGTIKALKPLGYEIINLGGGNNPVTITYLISLIENLLGKKAVIEKKDFHKADLKATWADISKANRLLDWTPQISFEEGIKRTVYWYLTNRDWIKEIVLK